MLLPQKKTSGLIIHAANILIRLGRVQQITATKLSAMGRCLGQGEEAPLSALCCGVGSGRCGVMNHVISGSVVITGWVYGRVWPPLFLGVGVKLGSLLCSVCMCVYAVLLGPAATEASRVAMEQKSLLESIIGIVSLYDVQTAIILVIDQ